MDKEVQTAVLSAAFSDKGCNKSCVCIIIVFQYFYNQIELYHEFK